MSTAPAMTATPPTARPATAPAPRRTLASRLSPWRLWADYWFAPSAATNLGISRALFFGLMFSFFATEPFAGWADIPREFWSPQWPFKVFHIPVVPRDAMLLAEIAWKASLALACVGALTRLSTIAAFVLGLYLLGLRHCFGKLGAEDGVLVLVMAVLAVSRCGDAFSLDALLRARRRGRDPSAPLERPVESGEYTWPIKAAWLVVSLVFFNSALAKLRFSGVRWALSDNFSILLVQRFYGADPKSEFGLDLAQIGWLCKGLAAGALLLELVFPLVLVSRWARWILVPSAYLMQYGNAKLLGVDFRQFTFVYVFFINWAWLGRTVRGWVPRRGRAPTASGAAPAIVAEPTSSRSASAGATS